MERIKVAVVNMLAEFADVRENMSRAEKFVAYAREKGAKLIVFPEFFTTGFALNDKLIEAVRDSWEVEERLKEWSKRYGIAIGGSYLKPDSNAKEVYNTFGLFFPSGEAYFHSKDIPTALESFCYTNGDEISAFETPLGRIGVVMCWEQLRYQTVKRLAGKADFLIGGSCWWGFAPEDGERSYQLLHDYNKNLAERAPSQLAEILGLPMVHASHVGSFAGLSLFPPQTTCVREVESRTQVVDAAGRVCMRGGEEPECLITEIHPGCSRTLVEIPEGRYWIPDLPKPMEEGFNFLNQECRKIYEGKVKPALFKAN